MTDELNMPRLLERLSEESSRPRYAFMVLNLLAQVSDQHGAAGPFIRTGDEAVSVRDWLCDALTPMGRRGPRRLELVSEVRDELARKALLPDDPSEAARFINDEVRDRVRKAGKTNVSRTVTELVRAGFLRRYYAGRWVNHGNRGGRRNAVYVLPEEVRGALAN